jgi:hypothetical protein
VETIPLADGNLRWVFPELVDEPQVLDILQRAAGCIEQLADHLGVRPCWTGSGLEFHRFPDQQTATLFGCAETTEVSLVAELRLPRDPIEWVVTPPPPWLVDAEISVRCEAAIDCGMHAIETKPDSEHASPVDAANGLLTATTWLLHRGTEEPASSRRQRDPRSGHH